MASWAGSLTALPSVNLTLLGVGSSLLDCVAVRRSLGRKLALLPILSSVSLPASNASWLLLPITDLVLETAAAAVSRNCERKERPLLPPSSVPGCCDSLFLGTLAKLQSMPDARALFCMTRRWASSESGTTVAPDTQRLHRLFRFFGR